jgi:hypothetical protein
VTWVEQVGPFEAAHRRWGPPRPRSRVGAGNSARVAPDRYRCCRQTVNAEAGGSYLQRGRGVTGEFWGRALRRLRTGSALPLGVLPGAIVLVLLFVFGSGSAATAPHRSIFRTRRHAQLRPRYEGCSALLWLQRLRGERTSRPQAPLGADTDGDRERCGRRDGRPQPQLRDPQHWGGQLLGRARDGELCDGGTASHSRPVPVRGLDGEGGAAHQAVTRRGCQLHLCGYRCRWGRVLGCRLARAHGRATAGSRRRRHLLRCILRMRGHKR